MKVGACFPDGGGGGQIVGLGIIRGVMSIIVGATGVVFPGCIGSLCDATNEKLTAIPTAANRKKHAFKTRRL